MDIRENFSLEYLCLYINYYQNILDSMPVVYLIKKRDGKHKIRAVDSHTQKIIHEYLLPSSQGQALLKNKEYRAKLQQQLDTYKQIWNNKTTQAIPKLEIQKLMTPKNFDDISFYNRLVPEEAFRKYGKNEHPYAYKGIYMRSKLEMLVATILDKLDLNYKYEPLLMLGNYEKYPDFFIALPFINACFPTEVAGQMVKSSYRKKTLNDLDKYYFEGYIFNKNLLLIIEDEDNPANDDVIASVICDFINRIVHEAFISAQIHNNLKSY
ncbi:MAG: hypothetical protein MJ172_10435 [Clostridia bacterium]|nr:hypothetical protein [Clostridia bacterium]